jgi:IclR family acetate operon transcriptional repressor
MGQLERALDLLELLGERNDMRPGELSTALGLPRATTHRLLSTLRARGYVEHVAATHSYRLGLAIQQLALQRGDSEIVRLAHPALAALRAATGETANLALLTSGKIVYAATLDGVHMPRMTTTVGLEAQPHATALGRAILAGLPAEERDALLGPGPLPGYTSRTTTDRDVLLKELDVAAERGYAVDDQETDVGAVCIAAAINGPQGLPVGGISISGITARMPADSWPQLARLVQDWCTRISDELTGAPPQEV